RATLRRREGCAPRTPPRVQGLRTEAAISRRDGYVTRAAHGYRDDTERHNDSATEGAQRPRERTDRTGQRAPRTDERQREDDRQGESTGQGERATPSYRELNVHCLDCLSYPPPCLVSPL